VHLFQKDFFVCYVLETVQKVAVRVAGADQGLAALSAASSVSLDIRVVEIRALLQHLYKKLPYQHIL